MKKIIFFERSIVRVLFLMILFTSLNLNLKSQNVVVTDDDGYTADSSAMLDVRSITKGLLIPRLTTAEKNAVGSPAQGLLVFDTDEAVFYYYDGFIWINLSKGQVWSVNSDYVILTNENGRVGIGTSIPNSKLEVMADASFTETDTLFAVKDKDGNVVFAVFPDGAKVYINEGAKGTVGGFAVSGRNTTKGLTNDYLVITPDSARIYINDTIGTKGTVGGFAVSGRNTTKALASDYLVITPDSARIYINDTIGAKGVVGGFAVSGRNTTKGITSKFMDMTPKNYLIGQLAGEYLTTGLYNTFMGYYAGRYYTNGGFNTFLGYQAGLATLTYKGTGNNNVAIGYQAGSNLRDGRDNVFIGTEAGNSTSTGFENTFIGYQAGMNNTTGFHGVAIGFNAGKALTTNERNTMVGGYSGEYLSSGKANAFFGTYAGRETTSGGFNTFIGYDCGYADTTGRYNTYVGFAAGRNADSDSSVLIGARAGYGLGTDERLYIENSSSNYPLIYGEFDNDVLVFNANSVTVSKSFPVLEVKTSSTSGTDAVLRIGGARTTSTTDELSRIEFYNYESGGTFEMARISTINSDGTGGTSNSDLYFKVNNGSGLTNAMIIDDNGKVGISTTNPSTRLHVTSGWDASLSNHGFLVLGDISSTNMVLDPNEITCRNNGLISTMYLQMDGGSISVHSNEANSTRFVIQNDGDVGICTPNPSYRLQVGESSNYGYVTSSGSWGSSSDFRYKENIEFLKSSLDKVLEIQGVYYNVKGENPKKDKQIGFIAQDLEKVLPEVVSTNPDGYKGISYSLITPILVEAIKELKTENDELKKRLSKIEKLLLTK